VCRGKLMLVCFRDRSRVAGYSLPYPDRFGFRRSRFWLCARVSVCVGSKEARVRTRVMVRVIVYHSRIVSDLVKVELGFV